MSVVFAGAVLVGRLPRSCRPLGRVVFLDHCSSFRRRSLRHVANRRYDREPGASSGGCVAAPAKRKGRSTFEREPNRTSRRTYWLDLLIVLAFVAILDVVLGPRLLRGSMSLASEGGLLWHLQGLRSGLRDGRASPNLHRQQGHGYRERKHQEEDRDCSSGRDLLGDGQADEK